MSDYFKAIRQENNQHLILRGDFFPYTENKDSAHPYWSGYFVHRPNFKRLERIVQGKLRRIDILRALNGKTDQFETLKMHRRNLALVQHHDAITGTSKPHVMDDYLSRLQAAEVAFEKLESDVLGGLDYVEFIDYRKPLEFKTKAEK